MQGKLLLTSILLMGVALPVQANPDTSQQAKPPLKTPEKASEEGHRTVPKPGKSESEQPPPDTVGGKLDPAWKKRPFPPEVLNPTKEGIKKPKSASHAHAASDTSHQPKPPLKTPEKASEKDQRTLPKPGKPEFEQPPPDTVGK